PALPEILLERGLAHVLERRNADRELLALRGAGERAPAACEVPGEILRVAGGDVERRRIHARPVVAHLEAGEALANVIGEVGLAELAVVDAVDAAVELLAHHAGDFVAQLRSERVLVVGLAFRPGKDHFAQLSGPRQRPRMRGENPLSRHRLSPSSEPPS